MPIKALIFDSGFCLQNDMLLFRKSLHYTACWLKNCKAIESIKKFKETFLRIDSSIHSSDCWSHVFAEPIVMDAVFKELKITKLKPEQAIKVWRNYQKSILPSNPRVKSALTWAKSQGLKTAILSNDRAERLYALIRSHNVQNLLDAVVVSEEVRVEKPCTKIFKICLKRLRTKGKEAIMFGDNPVSDGACKKLGMKFVLVTKYKAPFSWERGKAYKPDFIIKEVNKKNVQLAVKALSDS